MPGVTPGTAFNPYTPLPEGGQDGNQGPSTQNPRGAETSGTAASSSSPDTPKYPKTKIPSWMPGSSRDKFKRAFGPKAHQGLLNSTDHMNPYLSVMGLVGQPAEEALNAPKNADQLQRLIGIFFVEPSGEGNVPNELDESPGATPRQPAPFEVPTERGQVGPKAFLELCSAQKQVLDDIAANFDHLGDDGKADVLTALAKAAPNAIDKHDLSESVQRRTVQLLTVLTAKMPTDTSEQCNRRIRVLNARFESIGTMSTAEHAPKKLQQVVGTGAGVAGSIAALGVTLAVPPAAVVTVPLIAFLGVTGVFGNRLSASKTRKAQNTAASFCKQELDFVSQQHRKIDQSALAELKATWVAHHADIARAARSLVAQTALGTTGRSMNEFMANVDRCLQDVGQGLTQEEIKKREDAVTELVNDLATEGSARQNRAHGAWVDRQRQNQGTAGQGLLSEEGVEETASPDNHR